VWKLRLTPGREVSAFVEPARAHSHDLPHPHFFPSSLALGAGSSPVFFSLSHQSFQNFSSSKRFFSFANLSSRLESIVANHSSRAASSSARVAYWFMQLFIAFCCVRHEKVAVNVLLEQHAAKSKVCPSIACCFVIYCSLKAYLGLHLRTCSSRACSIARAPVIPGWRIREEASVWD
jgi:hypothetical protein